MVAQKGSQYQESSFSRLKSRQQD